MGEWLRKLWGEEARFKTAVRGLALGLGMAATTTAGGAVLDGDPGKVRAGQWVRFALSVALGAAGGAIAAGEKNRPQEGRPGRRGGRDK